MTLATRLTRDPVHPFDVASRDLDAFVQRVFGREGSATSNNAVDIYEDADELHVDAELPGFTKEQIDITIDNQVLTITADRASRKREVTPDAAATAQAETSAPKGDAKPNWLLRERRAARFQRSFSLPNTIDGNTVEATFTDGVLHVTLNKRQELKPRKISIA